MYSIFKNSYLQLQSSSVNPRIINRSVTKAQEVPVLDPFEVEPPFCRPVSDQPTIPIDNVDVTRRPLAFGRWALPKLRRELHHEDSSVVIAALNSLADLVHDPERAYEALTLRIPDRLADLLLDSLSPVRERAVLVLSILARQADGKEAIVSNYNLISNLKLCMGDVLITVRLKNAICLLNIAETWMTADVLVEQEFIEVILEYVITEVDDIVEVYLDTLKALMYGCGKCIALKNDAFKIFLNYLEDDNTFIVCKALECLAILATTTQGKILAIKKNLLPILNRLLHYGNTEVCTSAASVVMLCTIRTRAQIIASKIDSLPKILMKLSASLTNPSLQMFSIKALTNICGHPEVRKKVREQHLQDLEDLQVTEVNAEYKKILLQTVNWCPEKLE